jgi:hypothetical protein
VPGEPPHAHTTERTWSLLAGLQHTAMARAGGAEPATMRGAMAAAATALAAARAAR